MHYPAQIYEAKQYPDIKPDNIMVNWRQNGQNLTIDKVQVTDLENAAHLPKGRCIKGMLPGNENWRSPEGHCKGPLNKPTDIFSFGAVVLSSSPLDLNKS